VTVVDLCAYASAPLLQAGSRFDSAIQVWLTGYELVGAVLGLFIAYQAYRGYRRNESRPMLFMSLGFVLVVGVPVLLTVPFLLVPSIPQAGYQFVIQTAEVAGLVCIIYALRVDPAG
jgi:hypothetical protein